MMLALAFTVTVLLQHCHHFAMILSYTEVVGFDSDVEAPPLRNSGVRSPPILVHPLPSRYGNGRARFPVKRFLFPAGNRGTEENGEWRPTLLPEPDRPTFTPYIGARALTNLPKFFEHFRENLDSILEMINQPKSNRKGSFKIHREKIILRPLPLPLTRPDSLEGQKGSSSSTPIRFCRTRRTWCGGRDDVKKTGDFDLARF